MNKREATAGTVFTWDPAGGARDGLKRSGARRAALKPA